LHQFGKHTHLFGTIAPVVYIKAGNLLFVH
jgi:hypothetical protein